MKLNGSKSYIAGIALLMYAIGGAVSGEVELTEAIQVGLVALTLLGLRHGISKNGNGNGS